MNFLIEFFSEILLFFNGLFGNVGLALTFFTLIIRFLLLPLTLPSIKSSKKIRELQPELKKLKAKHKGNNQAYALAQSQLYKSYNINPLAGCLPQIAQLLVLIVLYRAITGLFKSGGDLNFQFLWADLSQPDKKYIFPVLAAASQFLLSLMISPATQTRDIVPNETQQKMLKKANEKEEDMAEMASSMQQQMMFMMPLMTGFIALRLPAGLALYWVIGTLFSLITQYFVSGLGGVATFWNKNIAAKTGWKLLPEEQGKNLLEKGSKKQTITSPKIKKVLSKAKDKKAIGEMAALLAKKGASTQPLKAKNQRATKAKTTKKVKTTRKKAKSARKAKKKK